MNSDAESDQEEQESFYMKFKETVPPNVKKDMSTDDMWLFMKRPLATNQNLGDIPNIVLAKSDWAFLNKQQKVKMSIIGDKTSVQPELYKYAFKSINLMGYTSMIENLIQFRQQSNPYVDSMLTIANSKSRFKVIHETD